MSKNHLNDDGVFNTRDDPDCSAAGLAGLNVDVEYALEALRPGH